MQQKFALSKLTQDNNIKVVLTGEGSDEHFAGYKDLLTDFVREPDLSWPHTSLSEEARLKIFNSLEDTERPDHVARETENFASKQVNNIAFIGFTQHACIDDSLFASWAAAEFGESDNRLTAVNHTIDGRMRELIAKKWHPLHSALYIWCKAALPNQLLTVLGDRVEMAHSVEGRQPFLDHRLTEYVMGLPPSMKFRYEAATNSFNEKWILKEAVKPFVTEELYLRKKHVFAAPVRYKLDGPIRKLFDRLITKENVEELGYFKWDACKDLVEKGLAKGERPSYIQMMLVGQLVVLGKRFGVKKAVSEFPVEDNVVEGERGAGRIGG
jgi:asparagine synthase (glutamine-hydrolysing)